MKTRAERVSRNFLLLSTSRFLTALLAMLVTFYLARVLGVERYGMIAFAIGLMTWAGVLVDAGLATVGARSVARAGAVPSGLVGAVFRRRFALLPVAMLLAVIVAWFVPLEAPGRLVVALYSMALIAVALDLRWPFIGRERMLPVALSEFGVQALMLVGALALVHRPEDLLRLPWIFLAARLLPALGLLVHFRRSMETVPPADGVESVSTGLLRDALPLGGASVLVMVNQYFPLLALGVLAGAEAAGWFGAAQRVIWGPLLLADAYYISLMTSINRGGLEGLPSLTELLERSLRLSGGIGIGLAVGGWMVAEPLIELFFGEAYLPAAAALKPLVVAIALVLMHRHYRLILVAFDAQRAVFWIYAVAGLVTVALTLAAIGPYGIAGAGFAMAAGHVCILLIEWIWTHRRVGSVHFWSHLLRPLPAASVMALALWWSEEWWVIYRIVFGGAIYLAGLWASGILRGEELGAFKKAAAPGS